MVDVSAKVATSRSAIAEGTLKERNEVKIRAIVRTKAETGVEMEALTAVSVAALTLYDMCKAITHKMEISDIRLVGKHGGKRDFGQTEL
ncbi:unnamed protein product [Anisakis simplex]|uniref:Molybdenum cofactor biosynthesis protein 1 (inferred by orthology to a D. melanogaster protein) n=1 Tax=Anisakis simplex TaxID=6269 RepID=A0A0M3KI32_ANISI|nr:unnamed protein product [Anisakis simplex]